MNHPFLTITNGLDEMMQTSGGDWFVFHYLFWDSEYLVERNLELWTSELYRQDQEQLRKYRFFGGPGVDGLEFGFPLNEKRCCEKQVWIWFPIDGEARIVASGFVDFCQTWMDGSIKF